MQPSVDVTPQRILIVLHGSIGDVTRALPLADLLRKKFPQAFLAWSIEPLCFPLLQQNPAIDEIIVFDRAHDWRKAHGFLARVRRGKFDLVLDLQRIFKSGFISWWSGSAMRIGFHRRDAKELNWIFNNRHIPACGDGIPKLEHYLKFADYLGIERCPLEWDFHLTADERASVDRLLGQDSRAFAVLFVGTRWESKQWFPAQIAQCADRLQRRHGLDVVLLGAQDDLDLANEACALSGVRLINLVGRTSLREAIGIIQRARLAVGPDTGLMHIAAAVKTPVISLWGATRPERTGPHGFARLVIQGAAPCVPCGRRECTIGRLCMRSITIEQIDGKIRQALEYKRAEPIYHASGE
jgi:lipopolysaccharide heptosyltransferase II